jgi:hypothetical protein
MKIIQLGCYNRNFGDSIAIYNPRRSINRKIPNLKWEDLCLVEEFHTHNCNVEKSSKQFESISKENDILFVGGAGLVESWPGVFGTHWKLPFNKKTLEKIKIPIIVYGVGLNFHRGCQDLTEKAFENLCLLIEQSECFSVRSDGSYENLHKFFLQYKADMNLFDKVQEVPDAGLIFDDNEQNKRISEVKNKIFNSAWSNKIKIREESRKLHYVLNNNEIKDILKEQYIFYPHTPKDYQATVCTKQLFSKEQFKNLVKTKNVYDALSYYQKFHLMFGLHAHAQLISIGKNVPCISYSSFDKTADFVKKHNLEEFNIEPEGKTKEEVAKEFIKLNNKFTNDSDFLNKWYEQRDVLVKKSCSEYEIAINKICEVIK